jgi:hypothetical protein
MVNSPLLVAEVERSGNSDIFQGRGIKIVRPSAGQYLFYFMVLPIQNAIRNYDIGI